MKVGFIGLGTMGAFIAANLQKAGHALVIHDIRREAGANRLAAGAAWADSPKAVAEQSEVIFTSLPGPKEVESVVFGPPAASVWKSSRRYARNFPRNNSQSTAQGSRYSGLAVFHLPSAVSPPLVMITCRCRCSPSSSDQL